MAAERSDVSNRKIYIMKTGEPVPKVRERRGEFADLITGVIGDAWSGGYETFDARESGPPDMRDAAALVITGSAANVPDREPWMLATEGFLREVVGLGVPTFGICFGHQILAQALGGEVQRNPRGREIGTRPIHKLTDDPIFDGLPEVFRANVTHVDTVVRLPRGATALAKNDLEDHHAIRFTETCYGVQFHPELDADVMRGYIEHRWEILAGEGFAVETLHADIEEGEFGRRTLLNFIRYILPRRAR
ncbi:glutamine amidotransferase [Polyangium sp. 15x6]|uniref:glutamine amidotransferase n=1 Tax=Polyangium sp. 15x6 TaxID=3042687 RepID=UPI00249CBFE5|nr:glutamine amidotransferase [Polyangium sp. 15x6]MDI3289660.1 glutamine amidotransferase [Polyangium sp. 15x6]